MKVGTIVRPGPDGLGLSGTGGDPIERLLRELVEEQVRQRDTLAAILRMLERGRGARDQADVALLVAVAEVFRDRRFTSGQIVAHADADLGLREALAAADITNGQELGCLFRRMEAIPVAGFRLERVGDQRAGVQWQVQVCEAEPRIVARADTQ